MIIRLRSRYLWPSISVEEYQCVQHGMIVCQVQHHMLIFCCRDGLERITVDAAGTVGTLRQQISSDLNMPREHVTLSKDQKLVSMHTCCNLHQNILLYKNGLLESTAFVQDARAVQRPQQQQAASKAGWCTARRHGEQQVKLCASIYLPQQRKSNQVVVKCCHQTDWSHADLYAVSV